MVRLRYFLAHSNCFPYLMLAQGLVGEDNLLLDPVGVIGMANLGILSPDGISYSFDHRANGYARGEGFGVVVVKRLDDALRHGDTIRGIVRATGSNQDGRTPGIIQPDGAAQEKLIRDIPWPASGVRRASINSFGNRGLQRTCRTRRCLQLSRSPWVECSSFSFAFCDRRTI